MTSTVLQTLILLVISGIITLLMAPSMETSLNICDPSKPLSSQDLTFLLFDHVTNSITAERKFIKETTKDEIKAVVDTFDLSFKAIIDGPIDSLHKFISSPSKKQADLDLKVETMNSYSEQLLYNLRSQVESIRNDLENHVSSYHASNQSCKQCDLTFIPPYQPNLHIPAEHVNHWFQCSACGITCSSESELREHIGTAVTCQTDRSDPCNIPVSERQCQEVQVSQFYQQLETACAICGIECNSNEDLNIHHQAYYSSPYICTFVTFAVLAA